MAPASSTNTDTMALDRLRHQFVEFMPPEIEAGVIYISLEYLTVIHRCCCGCGERVVTPIGPTDWSVTFHGDSVSMYPSIGNWGLACGSHYVIRHGGVEWAGTWSRKRIEAARRADHAAKERLFEQAADTSGVVAASEPSSCATPVRRRWWRRLVARRSSC
jgi:uncharacterized protein DUF6527